MTFSIKHLFASALALTLSAPALAGTSLGSLLSGETLTSNNGKLVFSDFSFSPSQQVEAASNIDVTTLDSGLLFGSPIFIDSVTGIIEFDVAYKVTAVDSPITGAAMQSTATYSGDAQANVSKTVLDDNGTILANLVNTLPAGNASDSQAVSFAAQGAIGVNDSFSAFGGGGTGAAGSAEVIQTYQTQDDTADTIVATSPTAIPSPTAALAGMALLGIIGLRRRRNG